jgi:hypothetical protein
MKIEASQFSFGRKAASIIFTPDVCEAYGTARRPHLFTEQAEPLHRVSVCKTST